MITIKLRASKRIFCAVLCALSGMMVLTTVHAAELSEEQLERKVDKIELTPQELHALTHSRQTFVVVRREGKKFFSELRNHFARKRKKSAQERQMHKLATAVAKGTTLVDFNDCVCVALYVSSLPNGGKLLEASRDFLQEVAEISDYLTGKDARHGYAELETRLINLVNICNGEMETLCVDEIKSKSGGSIAFNSTIDIEDLCVTGSVLTDVLEDKMTGTVRIRSNVCIDAGMTLSVDTIASKSGTLVAFGNDLCVSGTIRTDALHCKDNNIIDVDCDLRVNGEVLTDIIKPKTDAGSTSFIEIKKIDASTALTVKVGEHAGGDTGNTTVEMGFSGPLTTRTNTFHFGSRNGLNNANFGETARETRVHIGQLSRSGGVHPFLAIGRSSDSSTGNPLLEVAKAATAPGLIEVYGLISPTVPAVQIHGNEGICIDAALSLSVDKICAKTDGGAIDICTSLCLDETYTFSVRTIAAKGTDLKIGAVPGSVFVCADAVDIANSGFPPITVGLPGGIALQGLTDMLLRVGPPPIVLPPPALLPGGALTLEAGVSGGITLHVAGIAPLPPMSGFLHLSAPTIACMGAGMACMSDSRVKTDTLVVDVEDTLSKLATLTAYRFKVIEEVAGVPTVDQKPMFGFMGQELSQVFPELVTSDATFTFSGTDYPNFNWVLTAQYGSLAIAGVQGLDKRFSSTTGTTTFARNVQMDGSLNVDGVFTNPSDERVKEEVILVDPDESLKRVMQLKPVSYKFKPEFSGTPLDEQRAQRGFIAQDVEKVMPEVVYTAQAARTLGSGEEEVILDDFKALDYARLVVDLVGALQAEHARVQVLEDFKVFAEQQIAELKAEVAGLKVA